MCNLFRCLMFFIILSSQQVSLFSSHLTDTKKFDQFQCCEKYTRTNNLPPSFCTQSSEEKKAKYIETTAIRIMFVETMTM